MENTMEIREAEPVQPAVQILSDFENSPPELSPELIGGVLRQGHKMLISGASKAGKSFLLMELCVAIAGGRSWLGFPCRKGNVLYVNLEIDPNSCIHRFETIFEAIGSSPSLFDDHIYIWNLRGHAKPLDQLIDPLMQQIRGTDLSAIIIDPIYKVITGEENDASDMAYFCNLFDRICDLSGCSVIYCHHHSKGVQGTKRAMDRSSGSGVFARDPDAILDMIELEPNREVKALIEKEGGTPFRLEGTLREFRNFAPINLWFRYPIHVPDTEGILADLPAWGTPQANRLTGALRRSATTTRQAQDSFREAYDRHWNPEGYVTIEDMMSALGVKDKAIYARVKKMGGEFVLKKGKIYRGDPPAEDA